MNSRGHQNIRVSGFAQPRVAGRPFASVSSGSGARMRDPGFRAVTMRAGRERAWGQPGGAAGVGGHNGHLDDLVTRLCQISWQARRTARAVTPLP